MPNHTDNRLTADDRRAMRDAIGESIATWCDPSRISADDLAAFAYLACRAIGCTTHDLRDAELAEIRGLAADLAGLKIATQWCERCDVGPFFYVPARRSPRLCMDCADIAAPALF